MATINTGQATGPSQSPPDQGRASDASELVQRLNLPEEVTTRQAAEILGCCKHTVLQYLADGLLEWRDAAPPSSARPVYRFSLRSVLALRLGYKTDVPSPKEEAVVKPRKQSLNSSGHEIKHLRRKAGKT